MKLEDRMIDLERREEGAWVKDLPDWDDLELKVRGHNNKDWVKLEQKLINKIPLKRRINGLEPDDRKALNKALILETSLLDWRNVTNGNGEQVPYSKEQAEKYMADPRLVEWFMGACLQAALAVADLKREDVEHDAKN